MPKAVAKPSKVKRLRKTLMVWADGNRTVCRPQEWTAATTTFHLSETVVSSLTSRWRVIDKTSLDSNVANDFSVSFLLLYLLCLEGKRKDQTRFERVTYRTAAGCSTPELLVLEWLWFDEGGGWSLGLDWGEN